MDEQRPRTIVVAAFHDRRRAERAAAALDALGFEHAWLGAAADEDGDERVQALDPLERASRWIRFAGDERLVDALRAHGVAELDARRLADAIKPGNCVLVASGDAAPAQAAAVVAQHGGVFFDVFGPSPTGEG